MSCRSPCAGRAGRPGRLLGAAQLLDLSHEIACTSVGVQAIGEASRRARKRPVQPVLHHAVTALGRPFVIGAAGTVLIGLGEAMHRIAQHYELPIGLAAAHLVHELVRIGHGALVVGAVHHQHARLDLLGQGRIIGLQPPWNDTTAATSAPLRARSSTAEPPKQKPIAASLDRSMGASLACPFNCSSARLTRVRISARSPYNGFTAALA